MGRAFLIAVAGIGLLSLMDAMMKAQAIAYAPPQISLLRFGFGSIAILAVSAIARPPRPRLDTILANSWRAVLGVVTSMSFVFALSRLPLAETLALSLLSPCFTVLFGALLLRESVSRPIIVALVFGLVGMLVIVSPKLGGTGASIAALEGTAAVLLSTLTYSLMLVLLRSRATRDHPLTIVAVQNIGCTLIIGSIHAVCTPGCLAPRRARRHAQLRDAGRPGCGRPSHDDQGLCVGAGSAHGLRRLHFAHLCRRLRLSVLSRNSRLDNDRRRRIDHCKLARGDTALGRVAPQMDLRPCNFTVPARDSLGIAAPRIDL